MNYDVAIIGSGPSGATAAALLADAGYNVVMLDRGTQGAPHLPETFFTGYDDVLERLGVQSAIKKAYCHKMTASFFNKSGSQGLRISMESINTEENAGELVQLNRSVFDKTLVENAITCGVHYIPYHMVTEVQFGKKNNYSTLVINSAESKSNKICSRFIIDASGKSSVIGNQLGLKKQITKLDNRVAIFSHFIAPNLVSKFGVGTINIISLGGNYIFAIPLTPERISIGVVASDSSVSQYNDDIEQLFECELKKSEWVYAWVKDAKMVLPVISAMNYSYICEPLSDDRFILTGEAGAFLDPFFSNGVRIALKTGELAADVLQEVFKANYQNEKRNLIASYDSAYRKIVALHGEQMFGIADEFLTKMSQWSVADPHIPYPIASFMLVGHKFNSKNEYNIQANVKKLMNEARLEFT